jgi:hypothetical protein
LDRQGEDATVSIETAALNTISHDQDFKEARQRRLTGQPGDPG